MVSKSGKRLSNFSLISMGYDVGLAEKLCELFGFSDNRGLRFEKLKLNPFVLITLFVLIFGFEVLTALFRVCLLTVQAFSFITFSEFTFSMSLLSDWFCSYSEMLLLVESK